MTQAEFLHVLSGLTEYKWMDRDGQIVGQVRNGRARGKLFNPVTAVARSTRRASVVGTSERATAQAAQSLGLPESIANAVRSTANRGYTQVVRGRIQRAVGLG